MRVFQTELRKYVRSRFGIFFVGLLVFESLWVAGALFIAFHRHTQVAKGVLYALVPTSQIHSLLAPIILTVLASKLATLEHDSKSYKILFANGMAPESLFASKAIVLFICNVVFSFVQCAIVYTIVTMRGIAVELYPLVLYFVGISLAGIAVIAIQLYLALAYEKQQIALFVGGFGGLVGSLAMFVPKIVSVFLPWQYFGLLSPAIPTVNNGIVIKLTMSPHYFFYAVAVMLIGLVLQVLLAILFKKTVLR